MSLYYYYSTILYVASEARSSLALPGCFGTCKHVPQSLLLLSNEWVSPQGRWTQQLLPCCPTPAAGIGNWQRKDRGRCCAVLQMHRCHSTWSGTTMALVPLETRWQFLLWISIAIGVAGSASQLIHCDARHNIIVA